MVIWLHADARAQQVHQAVALLEERVHDGRAVGNLEGRRSRRAGTEPGFIPGRLPFQRSDFGYINEKLPSRTAMDRPQLDELSLFVLSKLEIRQLFLIKMSRKFW